MKRTRLNFLIDLIAFTGFVVLTTTGVLMRYTLPPGSGHDSTIWGLDRHEWGGLHFWVAVAFFSILALHLFLHWRWIATVVAGRPREGSALRAGLGIVGFLTIVALAVAPLTAPVERERNRAEKGTAFLSGHRYEDITVRGSMTLREVEETTGVPATHIIQSLQLPESISADERLGQLKQRFGFEIDEVRAIIKDYRDHK